MSYLTQSVIAANNAMNERVTQCAVTEGIPDAGIWGYQHQREWAAAPGWDEAWEYALNTHDGDPDYDPGKDEAVITDGMILSQVQVMTAAPLTPPPEPTE